jgi:endonuclease/exonuclease/phosphatase (EEP) superfamily protein YafD
MSKHSGPPVPRERNTIAVATIAVVGVLGLVVAILAIFRPADSAPSAAELTTEHPSVALTATPPAGQEIHSGGTLAPAPVEEATSAAPQKVDRVVGQLRKKTQAVVQVPPTVFRVGTFNVLGHSHTRPGGNKKGWASSVARTGWAVDLLNAYHVDVVGLQEFEDVQARTFDARTGTSWDVYPGNAGDPRNSIAWRTDAWELVSAATFPVPYFRGRNVAMPYVLLRDLESGQQVYVINVHNPATTGRHGNNEHWRDVATDREIALVDQLHAAGFPVVLTGDFNERDEVFCRVTGSGTMRAANGGTGGATCAPPADMDVDWIFGSSAIEWSNFVSTKAGLVSRATDHPLVVSDGLLQPVPVVARR